MNIDIDDIESRINEGIYGDDRMTATGRDDAFAALALLLDEVKRLRGEVSYLRACVPPTRPTDYGHEVWTAALRAEVAAERAAVLAWLEKAGWMPSLVEVFRRGEHRREEET